MNKKDNTINYYDRNAKEFFTDTFSANMNEALERFLKMLKVGDKVLDLGCGSGRDSLYIMKKGFDVVAIDGSEQMCKVATEELGQKVECIGFEDLSYDNEFDGIWACASLLHIEKENQIEIWLKIKKSLKQKGIIYASYKLGDYSGIRNGRYYFDVQIEELKGILEKVGVNILDIWESKDVRPSNNTKWINVICMKEK